MASAAYSIDDSTHLRISPELVLVDPDLAKRVRPRIPLLFRRRKPPLPVLHTADALTSAGDAADARVAAAS
ncbi:MAG TPA: hypothetical protein VH620_05385 [Gaiella sp.]|jgi:hypothetical protein